MTPTFLSFFLVSVFYLLHLAKEKAGRNFCCVTSCSLPTFKPTCPYDIEQKFVSLSACSFAPDQRHDTRCITWIILISSWRRHLQHSSWRWYICNTRLHHKRSWPWFCSALVWQFCSGITEEKNKLWNWWSQCWIQLYMRRCCWHEAVLNGIHLCRTLDDSYCTSLKNI